MDPNQTNDPGLYPQRIPSPFQQVSNAPYPQCPATSGMDPNQTNDPGRYPQRIPSSFQQASNALYPQQPAIPPNTTSTRQQPYYSSPQMVFGAEGRNIPEQRCGQYLQGDVQTCQSRQSHHPPMTQSVGFDHFTNNPQQPIGPMPQYPNQVQQHLPQQLQAPIYQELRQQPFQIQQPQFPTQDNLYLQGPGPQLLQHPEQQQQQMQQQPQPQFHPDQRHQPSKIHQLQHQVESQHQVDFQPQRKSTPIPRRRQPQHVQTQPQQQSKSHHARQFADLGKDLKPPHQDPNNTIEVHGSDVRGRGEDAYKYFFENKRKGGGYIRTFEVTGNNVIVIEFGDPAVAHFFLKKGQATIDDTRVKIQRHFPQPVYKRKVLLEYSGAWTSESLSEYLEARAFSRPVLIESGDVMNALLVTFETDIDASELHSACEKKPFRGKTMEVFEVPASRSLQVEGDLHADIVQDYFENKRSGNVDESEVTVEVLEENVLVHFTNHIVIEKILERKHEVSDKQLKVKVYHECIGSTRKMKKLPLDFEDVFMYGRFLKKSVECLQQVKRKLKDGMSLSVEEDRIFLHLMSFPDEECLEEILVGKETLADFLDHQELTVSSEFINKLPDLIKQLDYDESFVKCYTVQNTITITGRRDDVPVLKESLMKKYRNFESQCERVHLKQQQWKSLETHSDTDDPNMESFEPTKTDSKDENESHKVAEDNQTTKAFEDEHFNKEKAAELASSNKPTEEQRTCFLKEDLLYILTNQQWKSNIDHKKKALRHNFEIVPADNGFLLKGHVAAVDDVYDYFSALVKSIVEHTMPMRNGHFRFIEIHCEDKLMAIETKLTEHFVKIYISPRNFTIWGTTEGIDLAMGEINSFFEAILEKRTDIKSAHIVKFLMTKGPALIERVESEVPCTVEVADKVESEVPCTVEVADKVEAEVPCTVEVAFGVTEVKATDDVSANDGRKEEQIDVPSLKERLPTLVKGKIANQNVDVIVNSTNCKLKLSDNKGVSASLAGAAGPALQDECKKRYPKGIGHGEVAITSGGKLKCRLVFHVSVPEYKKDEAKQNIKDTVEKCLSEGERRGVNSISFPALGTGRLNYDRRLVAASMLEDIQEFWRDHPATTLTDVRIILYDKDIETVHAFEDTIRTSFKRHSHQPSSAVPTRIDKGAMGAGSLTIVEGDIATQKVDIIVNTTNKDMNLKESGAVSKALLRAGGSELQKACKSHKKGISEGAIAVTKPGKLHCETVYHIHLHNATDKGGQRKEIESLVKKVLVTGHQKKHGSIAIPALGTGVQKFDRTVVASAMLDSIHRFWIDNPNTSLVDVKIVVFDSATIRVYKHEQASFQPSALLTVKRKRFTSKHDPKKAQERRSMNTKIANCLEVTIFAKSSDDIDQAERLLERTYKEEMSTYSEENEYLKTMSHENQLEEMERQFGVTVDLQKKDGKLTITGMESDVEAMKAYIYKLRLDQKTTEEVVSSVEWLYCDEIDEKCIKFDTDVIENLERDFQGKADSHTLLDSSRTHYVVDFKKMIMCQQGCPSVRYTVRRIEAGADVFPRTWTNTSSMTLDKFLFNVTRTSKEYGDVSAKFASENKEILKIERVENHTLYKQYQNRKQLFEKRDNNIKPVERELWHGTAVEAIPSINKNGFNRSYCGKNAVCYGEGVYFAVNAWYSIQDKYASPDKSGSRYIYLVDVLTGEYTQGKERMKVLPAKDPAKPEDLFDSAVEQLSDPTMFVIFHDTQAYPKYLITFK